MRTVLLASLRTHARRYVAAVTAVVIGVAFVVTTAGLSGSAKAGLTSGLDGPFAHADAVVDRPPQREARRVLADAEQRGDAASVIGFAHAPVSRENALVDRDMPVGVVADTPSLRWQPLVRGRYPRGRDEAVVGADTATSSGLRLGDTLAVGSGAERLEVELVGVVRTPSVVLGSALYVPWEAFTALPDHTVLALTYAGRPPQQLEESFPSLSAQTPSAYVTDLHRELNGDVDMLSVVLLLFAAIALFVSVLVITNTFAILFAQRSRDFALLRCVGISRRRLVRSVRAEALAMGVAASLVGLLAGTGLAHLVVAVVRQRFATTPFGSVQIPLAWYLAAAAVGVGVTVLAAWWPTRAVGRVSPLAALRPEEAVTARTRAGRRRLVSGGVVVAAGVLLLAAAIGVSGVPVMILGGVVTACGVLLLGPVLVPGLIRLLDLLTRRLGVAARLASANAVRNPRRTASTTAALLAGVTLTTAVLTGLATSRAAVDADLDHSHPLDVALTTQRGSLPARLASDVGEVAGVQRAVALPVRTISWGQERLRVLGVSPEASALVRGDAVPLPGPGELVLPLGSSAGHREVEVTAGMQEVTLRTVTGGVRDTALVDLATFHELAGAGPTEVGEVWATADDDVDGDELAAALEALAGPVGAEVENGVADRAWVQLQLDVVTGSMVGLLGVAVLIALIGIGSTLGLSVLERTREIATLRALGLTRRQLRRTLAAEAVLLAVVATVLGTVIGLVYAWVGVRVMLGSRLDTPLVLPLGQLVGVVVVAALAGLAASVLPSRRALRVTPAAGLAVE